MMGQLPATQNALFYEFSLEHHIPDDHLLRQIDQFLDFDAVRQHLSSYYSYTGRPSIDPELMIRMLLLGYCYGIRSERRLCEEVNFNLAYRWFCRLGLEDAVPDHSTFSKNRHGRFRDSDLLRYVFNTVVTRCVEEGLVGGEGFAIDASLVRADANKQRREDSPVDWTPSEAGNNYEHYIKDTERFKSDTDYQEGWLAGEVEGKKLQAQSETLGNTAAGAYSAHQIGKEVDKNEPDKVARDAVKGIDTDALKSLEK